LKLIIVFLFLFAASSTVLADTTLEQIYSAVDITPDEIFASEVGPLPKTYNKQRGHKALAFALTSDGSFSVGMGFKAPSEFAASLTAKDRLLDPDLASFKTRILDDRNEQWMVKIDELLQQEKNTAVMVGATHFGGERGLLALLRARGLEPVQYSSGGTALSEITALSE